jgi:hypothetical protein
MAAVVRDTVSSFVHAEEPLLSSEIGRSEVQKKLIKWGNHETHVMRKDDYFRKDVPQATNHVVEAYTYPRNDAPFAQIGCTNARGKLDKHGKSSYAYQVAKPFPALVPQARLSTHF